MRTNTTIAAVPSNTTTAALSVGLPTTTNAAIAASVREGQSATAATATLASVLGSDPTGATLAARSVSLLGALQRCVGAAANAPVPEPTFPAALIPSAGRWLTASRDSPSARPNDGAKAAHRAAVVFNMAVCGAVAVTLLVVAAAAAAALGVVKGRGNASSAERSAFVVRMNSLLQRWRWPGVLLVPILLWSRGRDGVVGDAVAAVDG